MEVMVMHFKNVKMSVHHTPLPLATISALVQAVANILKC